MRSCSSPPPVQSSPRQSRPSPPRSSATAEACPSVPPRDGNCAHQLANYLANQPPSLARVRKDHPIASSPCKRGVKLRLLPIPSVLRRITLVRLARRDVKERMWTEAHWARHEARLKDRVRVSAVGEVARWLERADPPRSPRRTPLHRIVAALAWHLRVGGPWRGRPVAGAARRFPAVAHRLWLVPTLVGGWRF